MKSVQESLQITRNPFFSVVFFVGLSWVSGDFVVKSIKNSTQITRNFDSFVSFVEISSVSDNFPCGGPKTVLIVRRMRLVFVDVR